MRALVLLVLAVLLAAPTAAQEDPRAVKTMVLGPSESQQVRQFFGTVVARQTVDLAFQVAGQLVSFPVVEGQPVEKGAIVAALDQEPFELALARAQVEKAQADRARARLEALSERTVSEASLEDARSAAQLAAIAVRDARRSLENATLHAPFDGLVAARLVANFATVQAGAPVVRLHDIGEWRVEIEVPEVLFRRAGADPDLDLTLAFPQSDRRIPLELREFNAEASAVGQTFTITLALLEEPGAGVLPGSSAIVVTRLKAATQPPALPASAVVIAPDGGTFVMRFEPSEGEAGQDEEGADADGGTGAEGTVRRVPVTLGAGPDGQFLVQEGLAEGDEIVVAGAQMLEDGQPVRRFTGFPD